MQRWLPRYAPFQGLSSQTTTAAYVTTIIKAANVSGAAMIAMLKAQIFATLLDVCFSGPGGRAGASPRLAPGTSCPALSAAC